MSAVAATVRPKIDCHPVASAVVTPCPGPRRKRSKDQDAVAKLIRLQKRIQQDDGRCVQSVEAVMLVHAHNHPHVLLMRRTPKPASLPHGSVIPSTSAVPPPHITYRLPGGKVRADRETHGDCLYRKLARDVLGFVPETEDATVDEVVCGGNAGASSSNTVSSSDDAIEYAKVRGLRVGEPVSVWYRPNFDRPLYPYVPAHVTEPKEERTLFLVHMPAECVLMVTEEDTELVAVPLFDLYENAAKYGPVIASLPHVLSRFKINLM